MTDTAQRLWAVVEPYLAAENVELDDIEVRGGKGRLVRVVIDAEGGVDIDRVAELSRGISRLLQDESGGFDDYPLEVSSPGLERKLRRPRHYEKSIGKDVKVKTSQAIGGNHAHRGTLLEAGPEDFTLSVAGEERTILYADVVTATTVFEWKSAPKPGRTQQTPAKQAADSGERTA